jgi:prolipoprotein diacylglyceryltransferase
LTTETINVGPLALPTEPLVLLLSLIFSIAVGKWACRKSAVDIEPSLWKMLYVGLFTARVAFVLIYFDSYRMAPWTIIDIRDGGFITPVEFFQHLF